MIFKITEVLKQRIEDSNLSYIETLAGLTRIEHVEKKKSKDSLIQKSYPIYCDVKNECDQSKILPLVPGRKKKSLFYFEDLRGVTVNDTDSGFVNYTGYVRLIAWLNPKLLGSEDCSITAPITNELINILLGKTFNSGDFAKIKTRILSIPSKGPHLFSKYKYNRNFIELLDKPYDYFALDIAVDFSIHKNCINKYIVNTPITC
jgi:hypothetical protein